MSIHRPRPAPKLEPGPPEWVRRFFFEVEPPGKDDAARGGFAEMSLTHSERALWARWRDELLSVWVEKHPGVRPPGWWKYEAKSLRRPAPGQGVEWNEDPRGPWDWSGVPHVWPGDSDDEFFGELRIESQASFLKRLGLLLEGERPKRTAYRPQVVDFDVA